MITYPRFTYDSGPSVNLDFSVFPFKDEYIPNALTFLDEAPGADIGSTTETVTNYIRTDNFIFLKNCIVTETDIDDFWSWWDFAKRGKSFTFYPDKDTPGTSYTVIEEMKAKFKPKKKDGLYLFDIRMRDVS